MQAFTVGPAEGHGVLALHNHGRFHLGATWRWPLNNRPFLGGPARIDEFTKISARAGPAFEQFRDALVAINQMDSEEILAAYLRVRAAVQRRELAARRAALSVTGSGGLAAGLTAAEIFAVEDPRAAGAARRWPPRGSTAPSPTCACAPSTTPLPATCACSSTDTWWSW
jgi:hypothetical protein